METTHKIQISISALILAIAIASFLFGSGAMTRLMSTGPPAQISQNATEKNMIVGVWQLNSSSHSPDKDKDQDPDQDQVRTNLVENWTFYPDGTFAESHTSVGSDMPPIYDNGIWTYLGNSSYVVSMNGEEMHLIRTGNILTNEDDQCVFNRIES
jgi:hypothetical protein